MPRAPSCNSSSSRGSPSAADGSPRMPGTKTSKRQFRKAATVAQAEAVPGAMDISASRGPQQRQFRKQRQSQNPKQPQFRKQRQSQNPKQPQLFRKQRQHPQFRCRSQSQKLKQTQPLQDPTQPQVCKHWQRTASLRHFGMIWRPNSTIMQLKVRNMP